MSKTVESKYVKQAKLLGIKVISDLGRLLLYYEGFVYLPLSEMWWKDTLMPCGLSSWEEFLVKAEAEGTVKAGLRDLHKRAMYR